MKNGARWYWGGTALGALMVVVLIITAKGAWGIDDIVWMVVKGWFLIWILIHLLVVLGWMTIHFFDGDSNNNGGGSAGSSGVEWGRLGTWYLRGRLRNQMRKASRW